jgi:hypothetical protein
MALTPEHAALMTKVRTQLADLTEHDLRMTTLQICDVLEEIAVSRIRQKFASIRNSI